MYLALTDEQQALRDELRAYFTGLVTDELAAELAVTEGGGPLAKQAIRKMAADGWLGIGWPERFGGQGRTRLEQYLFYDEAQRAGAPVPFLTINTIGPALQEFGTPSQQERFLPGILAGEIFFSIGYTEPGAGTDLGSLTTRADRDGDDLVINGQKIYTSLVDHADFVWLACRTTPMDPDAGGDDKHAGISIVIVPTDADGFSRTPIDTMGDARTYATYYQDVRVPVDHVVGGEDGLDQGWRMIVTQLNYERVSLCSAGLLERKYVEVRRWAQQTKLADGRPGARSPAQRVARSTAQRVARSTAQRVVDQPWVRVHLAKVHAKLEALRLINYKVAADASLGITRVQDSSATKVYGTELYCEAYGLLLEVMGNAGLLHRTSAEATLHGSLERAYRGTLILTFGGGVNEVQRDLISVFGLGMPRPLR